MAMKLKWDNANVVANSIKIYRGDAPLDSKNLPAPLVNLTNGENEWIDPTAEFGNTYYYIFGTKTENDEVFTPNQMFLVGDNRGVGPNVLQAGNDALGYYGQVLASDFVNSAHIYAVAATMAGLPNQAINPTWYKFIRNGKIIYIPSQNFGFATWAALYQAGFVYGTKGNGPDGVGLTGLTPTVQERIINFKSQKYKVRLMKGGFDRDVFTAAEFQALISANDMDTYAAAETNEFTDLFYPLSAFVPNLQRLPNVEEIALDGWLYSPYNASYNSSSQITETARGRIWVQERHPTTASNAASAIVRGLRPVAYSTTPTFSRANLTAITGTAGTSQGIWVPVLELIDEI